MWKNGLSQLFSGLRRLHLTPAAVDSFMTSGLPASGGAPRLFGLTSLLPLASAAGPSSCAQPAGVSRGYSAAAQPPGGGSGAPQPLESIEEIRARIFGTHIGNGLRSGRKVLRNKLLGPTLAAYYPSDLVKADPLMVDLKAERAKLKLDRLKRRGKAPPKKGAGKRSTKKK